MFCLLQLVKGSSFQVGHRFYYWDQYKSNDLYVEKKHALFKEELKEYNYLSLKFYQNKLVPKVMKYIDTNKVKRMRARAVGAFKYFEELKREIESDSRIQFNHLLSICLYTDYSDLCTDFSKSFRALTALCYNL